MRVKALRRDFYFYFLFIFFSFSFPFRSPARHKTNCIKIRFEATWSAYVRVSRRPVIDQILEFFSFIPFFSAAEWDYKSRQAPSPLSIKPTRTNGL